MKKQKKLATRALAVLVVVMMCVGFLGTSAFAATKWIFSNIEGNPDITLGGSTILTGNTSSVYKGYEWEIRNPNPPTDVIAKFTETSPGTCTIEGVAAGTVKVLRQFKDLAGTEYYQAYYVNVTATVNFDPNDGAGEGFSKETNTFKNPSSFNYDADPNTDPTNGRVTRPDDDPTRKGYTFTGWYTEPEGGSLYDFSQRVRQSDLTLYAHWKCDHTEVVTDEAVEPSCDETGMTEGSHCEVCGDVIEKPEEIEALGHAYPNTWTDDAENGDHYRVCQRDSCHVEERGDHHYGEWTGNTNPGDEQTRECTGCGHTQTRVVASEVTPAHKHTFESKDKKDGTHQDTCTDPECDEIRGAREEHRWNKDGDGKCEDCGADCPHENVTVAPEKTATCEDGGLTAGKTCDDCDMVLEEQKETEALDHIWGEWTDDGDTQHKHVCERDSSHVETENHRYGKWEITKEPTDTEKGVQTLTCMECGHVETREFVMSSQMTPSEPADPSESNTNLENLSVVVHVVESPVEESEETEETENGTGEPDDAETDETENDGTDAETGETENDGTDAETSETENDGTDAETSETENDGTDAETDETENDETENDEPEQTETPETPDDPEPTEVAAALLAAEGGPVGFDTEMELIAKSFTVLPKEYIGGKWTCKVSVDLKAYVDAFNAGQEDEYSPVANQQDPTITLIWDAAHHEWVLEPNVTIIINVTRDSSISGDITGGSGTTGGTTTGGDGDGENGGGENGGGENGGNTGNGTTTGGTTTGGTTTGGTTTGDDTLTDIPEEDVPLTDIPEDDVPLTDIPEDDVLLTDIPEEDVPLTDIPEEDVPLADIPEEDVPLADIPEDDGMIDIFDDDVPLADVPQTGDAFLSWVLLALASGTGLALLVLTNKKRENAAE